MDLVFLKYIGAGLMSIGMMGASIGIGLIFSSLINALDDFFISLTKSDKQHVGFIPIKI